MSGNRSADRRDPDLELDWRLESQSSIDKDDIRKLENISTKRREDKYGKFDDFDWKDSKERSKMTRTERKAYD